MKTIKLPDVGEGVKEGELKAWLVKEGDHVQVDDVLAEVLTDKAVVEVPSPYAGKVTALKAQVGDAVPVGAALLELDPASATATAAAVSVSSEKPALTQPTESVPAAPVPTESVSTAPVPAATQVPDPTKSAMTSSVATPPVVATPATRRLAREMGVDLSSIKGTGLAGRVTREDVLKHQGASTAGAVSTGADEPMPATPPPAPPVSMQAPVAQVPAAQVSAAQMMAAPVATPLMGFAQAPQKIEYKKTFEVSDLGEVSNKDDVTKPLQGVRRKIAQHLQHTKQVVPHFTIYNEARVEKLISFRDDLRATHGVKITYLPFIMKALARVLVDHPHCNASIDDEKQQIIYKNNYHVGFACDAPGGLLVPVVRHAGEHSVLQLHNEVVRLSGKVRRAKATRNELQGATVSITNIGSIGGLMGTPIINHPEVLILGVYNVVTRPVWVGVQWVPQRVMGFTVTCDHRLIDGAAASKFLKDFIHSIEHPASLLV